MKHLFFACLILVTIAQASLAQSLPQLGKDPVDKVVASMTLKEKARFVTGNSMLSPQSGRMVPGAAGTTCPIPRLGIPAQVLADGPAGLRISPRRKGENGSYYCTAFPVATLLASTWDTGLIYKVGEAMGNEALEYGVDVILGPGLNIHRNPLCGRNFEYYSEDPFLTGILAASMVKGIQSQGVGACIKHFAANNTETDRNALNTVVSERALQEIYLEGFRIAVEEAQPRTVMSSYNLINGTYAPESCDLLTRILREEWGFQGYVMTDWFGGRDPVAMMNAGNDLLMPGTPMQARSVLSALKKGKLDVGTVDRNISRILNIIQESPRFKGYRYSNNPDLEQHAGIAREAAGEGMVLLKNDNRTLPLSSATTRIAIYGKSSFAANTGGTGSGDVNEAYSVSIAEGLRDAGYNLNENGPEAADIALITIGRNSGEFRDRKVEGDFNLTEAERNLIKSVTEAFRAAGKKTVVILNIGGVIETASWKDMPNAILLAWQAGQETGHAIADVISGKVNPSGKLAVTFPVNYQDTPSARNFPGTPVKPNRRSGKGGVVSFLLPTPSTINYEEGIYVGYRHYSTFGVPVSYEFGFGRSYTRFSYGNPIVNSDPYSGQILVTLDIKNEGDAAGREVVQLYLTAPAGKLDKPAIELKGFAKTRLLQPGDSQKVTFVLSPRSLASFDPETSAWIAEAGEYTVRIGASSEDIRHRVSFSLNKVLVLK